MEQKFRVSDSPTSQEARLAPPGSPGGAQNDPTEKTLDLSFVIPAFNEEPVLQACLDSVDRYGRASGCSYEILVVDDGSTDRTREIALEFSAGRNHFSLLNNDRNRGKGYAVKRGMLAARGELILFLDADLSTHPQELDRMTEWLKRGFPVVIGTRRIEGSQITKHQSFVREKMGSAFTLISRCILGLGVSDFTCGFKCFHRDAAQALFSRQQLNDWSFDAEVLHIAKKLDIGVKEVPVQWANAGDSKVNLLRDAARSLLGLLRIRWNSLAGRYRK